MERVKHASNKYDYIDGLSRKVLHHYTGLITPTFEPTKTSLHGNPS